MWVWSIAAETFHSINSCNLLVTSQEITKIRRNYPLGAMDVCTGFKAINPPLVYIFNEKHLMVELLEKSESCKSVGLILWR